MLSSGLAPRTLSTARLDSSVLLESRDVRWAARPDAAPMRLRIKHGHLYLRGTAGLIDALVCPEEHLSSGSFLMHGHPPQELLRSGQVGICPARLPAPQTTRVIDALTTSARLMGLASSTAQHCLKRVDMVHHQKLTLEQLCPEQHRRVGIAHGLLTEPDTLIFSAPFSDLSDTSRQAVSDLMEHVCDQRLWIVAGEPSCPISRRWSERADSVLIWDGHQLCTLADPDNESRPYFVCLKEPHTALNDALVQRGAELTLSENPRVLLVTGLNRPEIAESCAACSDCEVESIEAAEERCFRNIHARSAL